MFPRTVRQGKRAYCWKITPRSLQEGGESLRPGRLLHQLLECFPVSLPSRPTGGQSLDDITVQLADYFVHTVTSSPAPKSRAGKFFHHKHSTFHLVWKGRK